MRRLIVTTSRPAAINCETCMCRSARSVQSILSSPIANANLCVSQCVARVAPSHRANISESSEARPMRSDSRSSCRRVRCARSSASSQGEIDTLRRPFLVFSDLNRRLPLFVCSTDLSMLTRKLFQLTSFQRNARTSPRRHRTAMRVSTFRRGSSRKGRSRCSPRRSNGSAGRCQSSSMRTLDRRRPWVRAGGQGRQRAKQWRCGNIYRAARRAGRDHEQCTACAPLIELFWLISNLSAPRPARQT
jgi:hypothetical protein